VAVEARDGPIVFAVATAAEKRACSAAIEAASAHNAKHSYFLQTGSGPLRLETLAPRITRLGAAGLISIGTAGGLSRSIAPGTLLVPKRVIFGDGRVLSADPDWQAQVYRALEPHMPLHSGDLLTVSELVRRPEQKRALRVETKAVGVDMESGHLAQLARQIGIRFLTLRAVMDAVDDEIPGAAVAAVNDQGDTVIGGLLKYLLGHPGDLPGLIRTARRFRVAAASLGEACRVARDALLRSP
jgi:adenosylhomocysteine nucleosidase